MSSEIGPDEAGMSEFEQSIGSLKPASRVSRDQILFRAGQEQARAELASQPLARRRGIWPAVAACLAVVVLGQSILLARRPGAEVKLVYGEVPQAPQARESTPAEPAVGASQTPHAVEDRPVAFDKPGPEQLPKPLPVGTMLTSSSRLNWQLINQGLDALPATPVTALPPGEKPLTVGQPLEINRWKTLDPGESL